MGYVKQGTGSDQLNYSLEHTIHRLEKDKATNCLGFMFSMPDVKCVSRIFKRKKIRLGPIDELFLKIGWGCYLDFAQRYHKITESHELRHVFDCILSPRLYSDFAETTAEMYTKPFNMSLGLKRDYKNKMNYLNSKIKGYEKGINKEWNFKSSISQIIREEYENLLQGRTKEKECFEKIFHSTASTLQIPSMERPALSYLFSTTPSLKIPHRIKLVSDYLLSQFEVQGSE